MSSEKVLMIVAGVIIAFLLMGLVVKTDEAYKQGYKEGYSAALADYDIE